MSGPRLAGSKSVLPSRMVRWSVLAVAWALAGIWSPAPVGATSPPSVATDSYEWRQLPIGGGGFVTGIVATPDGAQAAVYARTDVGGAYRWEPDSQSWVQMLRAPSIATGDLAPGDYSVLSIAVAPSDPDVVYVAVGADAEPAEDEEMPQTGRVLRSTDGGRTWTSTTFRWFIDGNHYFRTGGERLAVDPTDPDRVAFGTPRQGLWTSADGAETWTQVSTDVVPIGIDAEPGPQAGVSVVAYVPPVAPSGPATLIVGAAHQGVFASIDHGATWVRRMTLYSGDVPSSASPAGEDLVFSVDRPRDHSASLHRLDVATGEITDLAVPSGANRWNVAVDPHDPERMVLTDEAVRDKHLWTSVDGGQDWRSHSIEIHAEQTPWLEATDLDSYMSAGRLMFDPVTADRLWFAEGMGVWQTADLTEDTVELTAVSQGIEELVVFSVVAPPDGGVLVAAADRQGFRFATVDSAAAGPLVDERFASGTSIDYSAGTPSVLAWVGAESNVGSDDAQPRGAVSRDGGETWTEMGDMVPEMYGGEVAVSATDPDTIVWLPTHRISPWEFIEEPVGLYVSSDGGSSWEHVSPDGDVDSFHRFFWWPERRALAADRVNGAFYLLSDEERFYVSTDGARTWSRANHAPPCNLYTVCQVYGQVQAVPGAEGSLWASMGLGLYRSEDAGASPWTKVDGMEEARAFAFGAPIGDATTPAVYVHGRRPGDSEFGIWRTADGGESWTLVTRHPHGLALYVNTLAGDPNVPGRVYVGFGGGSVVVGDDPALIDGE